MVIRGNARGNGKQLAKYLMTKQDNEAIRILDVDGQDNADARDLYLALHSMQLTSELTKSDKGLYHAQINPATDESKNMDDAAWLLATDILAERLGMEGQRRAIVLHTKKGRTHAHVVFERYHHETGKMVKDSFSRLAQDKARKEMEAVFKHKATPHRNKHRPELKASLSALWHSTGTGAQFLAAARKNDYIIGEGSGRSAYIVVDAMARSYDLTRQLNGVRVKEVRQRLRGLAMPGEKEAISIARKKMNEADLNKEANADSVQPNITMQYKERTTTETAKPQTVKHSYTLNTNELTGSQPQRKEQLKDNKADINTPPAKQDKPNEEKNTNSRRLAFREEMNKILRDNKSKDKGKDIEPS
ncbi:hypothetical protein CAP35_04750 [Chitinophagaceae bacterium IBVUCB1]|nr:hypothetical protein CAP35_04750 [Chitinophagaceae bacterium IBVUCB1]